MFSLTVPACATLAISTPQNMPRFKQWLRDGSHSGMKLEYAVQPRPDVRAHAFIISKEFLAGAANALVLGNKIFYRYHLQPQMMRVDAPAIGTTLFAYHVQNTAHYGVAAVGTNGKASGIEENPHVPKSNYAVTGLYFYDGQFVGIAKSIKPIFRGEGQTAAVNQVYLARGQINVQIMLRGLAWSDAGTQDSLLGAGQCIATLEHRQGLKIACFEEIAWRYRFIDDVQLEKLSGSFAKNGYRQNLPRLFNERGQP